jgi:hypothetical protein
VGEVQRAAGAARDVDHLLVGGERAGAVTAVVRAVIAPGARDGLAQRHELRGRGVHAGRVREAGGEAQRALVE